MPGVGSAAAGSPHFPAGNTALPRTRRVKSAVREVLPCMKTPCFAKTSGTGCIYGSSSSCSLDLKVSYFSSMKSSARSPVLADIYALKSLPSDRERRSPLGLKVHLQVAQRVRTEFTNASTAKQQSKIALVSHRYSKFVLLCYRHIRYHDNVKSLDVIALEPHCHLWQILSLMVSM